MKRFAQALLLVVLVLAVVVAAAVYSISRRGLSTRGQPSAAEEWVARSVRRLATPDALRDRRNPIEPSQALLDEALGHFADHCATCHGNDGSGQTSLGQGFYPKAPDMRASETQSLSDGELFSIIENGIRLTGMPAWGDGTREGERSTWGLVHFIRRLPSLTDEQIQRMEALNPRTPAQFREEDEARRFLAGEDAPVERAAPPQGHEH